MVLKYKELQTTIAIITETKLLNYFVLQMIFTSFFDAMMEKPCVQVHKFPLRYRQGSFLQGRMDYNISISQLPFVCYHCHFVEHGNKYLQQPSYVQHSFSARKTVEQNEC